MKAPAKLTAPQEALWTRFWAAYPRKVGRVDARSAWAEAVLRGRTDPEFLVRAAARHAEYFRARGTDEIYIPHAATWLRRRRFEDEHLADPVAPAPSAAPTPALPGAEWWPAFERAGMTYDVFIRWVAPIEIIAGTSGATVIAPSRFCADWLSQRLGPVVARALGCNPVIRIKSSDGGDDVPQEDRSGSPAEVCR